MATVFDVAKALIEEQHAANRSIDKKQLQKLLYLVQGAHLELWDKPAFPDDIKAYRNGPVVGRVEWTYRNEYPPGTNVISEPIGGSSVTSEIADTVRLVLSMFGTWDANELEAYTKTPGSPWRNIWGDRDARDTGNDPIPVADIAAWFGRNGTNPSAERLSDEDRGAFARLAEGDMEAIADLLQ